MKSDPRAAPLAGPAVAGLQASAAAQAAIPTASGRIGALAWLAQALLFIAIPLALLVAAAMSAIVIVRIGADWRLGLDPFLDGPSRPRLTLTETALRGVAADVVRQFLIALLVIGLAWWQDGAAWPRRLALTRPAEPRKPLRWLWLLLALWPAIHILWVTETAAAMRASFGRGTHLSPFLTREAIAAWFLYVGLLAPAAEEMLMRGEAFARASRFLNPAGAIAATALLFCVVHISETGIARPISLLPLAVTLGWLRWRTGRLWPCILLHGWSNLALIGWLFWPHWAYPLVDRVWPEGARFL